MAQSASPGSVMGEYDDRRVEPKTVLVGMGMGATPERLGEIEQRRRELEKLSRPKPTEAFEQVMARRRGPARSAAVSPKEQKRQALPRRGPRPGLVHPDQRDEYGRDEESKSKVVLKG
jgi:hypothetical protein